MADLFDEEKLQGNTTTVISSDSSKDERQSPTASTENYSGILGKLRYYENTLDRKFGIESHGPARILPEARDPSYNKWSNQAVMALMWASGTMNLSCFVTGFLGFDFGLDLKQAILVVVFGSLLGSAVTVSISRADPFCE